jgi:hypothetical protein
MWKDERLTMRLTIPDRIIGFALLLCGVLLGAGIIKDYYGYDSGGGRMWLGVAVALIPGALVLYLDRFRQRPWARHGWVRAIGWMAVAVSIVCSWILYCILRWYTP